jgi:hypothetical protein
MTLPPAWLRILAVAAAAVLGLIALVAYEQWARAGGTEVAMTMDPVDPQSLLSGHYVTVSLNEALPAGAPCPPGATSGALPNPYPTLANRTGLWVALARNAGHYSVAGVAQTREAAAKFAPLVVQGDAYCEISAPTAPGAVSANLGIERVSLSQADAQRITDLTTTTLTHQGGPVLALLSIGQDGKARMKGLVANGQRIVPSWY